MTHPNKQNFIDGLDLIFSQWTAMALSVQNEWGGHDTCQKCTEFKAGIIDYFQKEGKSIEIEDLEIILAREMANEFGVFLEDESERLVAKSIWTLYWECVTSKTDFLETLRSRASKSSLANVHVDAAGEGQTDSETDTDTEICEGEHDLTDNFQVSCAAIRHKSPFLLPTANKQPSIRVEAQGSKPFGYLIYNYEDAHLLKSPYYFCTPSDAGIVDGCSAERVGSILWDGKIDFDPSEGRISGEWVTGMGRVESNYKVSQTGYYCARIVNPEHNPITLSLEFVNPHGWLPAEYTPLYTMSMLLCLAYVLISTLWGYLTFYRHVKYTNGLQKMICVLFVLMAVECAVIHGWYRFYNTNGHSSKFLNALMVFGGAAKSVGLLYLLLMVSGGWGILRDYSDDGGGSAAVNDTIEIQASSPPFAPHNKSARPTKPFLQKSSIYCLSIVHFLFSLLTGTLDMMHTQNQVKLLVCTLPYTLTTFLFIIFILRSLQRTKIALASSKQTGKLQMYKILQLVLTGIFVAGFFFTVTGLFVLALFTGGDDGGLGWYAANWRWLWFWVCGWKLLLCLFGTLGITWIWRPRHDNPVHGMYQIGGGGFEGHEAFDDDDGDSAHIALRQLSSERIVLATALFHDEVSSEENESDQQSPRNK